MRETQVTPTPRMIALCSGDMPSALREQLLRKIRDVQYTDISMVEEGKGTNGQGQGRPNTPKGKSVPQKSKTVKRMNKSIPKLSLNDAPIPTVQEAQIAQLQPELKRPQNAKKIKAKC